MTMQRELDLFGLEKRRLRDYVTKTNTAEKGGMQIRCIQAFPASAKWKAKRQWSHVANQKDVF